ncbi:MAG: hypothetical protein MRZ26_01340 [Ruminococcus sp.]|nr:hypothetical protein [Ruminococcus sp.]
MPNAIRRSHSFRVYADRRYLAAFEGIRNIKAYPCLYAKIDRASEILGLHPFVDRLLLNHSDTVVYIGGSVFIEPKDGTVFPFLTSHGICIISAAISDRTEPNDN